MNPTGADHDAGRRRPAAEFWAAERRERLELAAAFAAKARQEMLEAGGIDPATLPAQARRILDWLTESDQPTVDGIAGLLSAAYEAGLAATKAAAVPDRTVPDGSQLTARLDAFARRPAQGLEL